MSRPVYGPGPNYYRILTPTVGDAEWLNRKPADRFKNIGRALSLQIMRLGTRHNESVVDAATRIQAILEEAGLDLRALADRVEGSGAVPRKSRKARTVH